MSEVLAGDVGGTKTLLGVFRVSPEGLTEVCSARFASQAYDSLAAILAEFLAQHPERRLDAACVAVAGPVVDGACTVTNLPWRLQEDDLARDGRAPVAKLVNDMEAAATGVLHLPGSALAVLNPGEGGRRHGNAALIAAGTGLGEAILYWDGARHHAIATEGGHADFAPHTDMEIELLRFLRARHGGHVSCERVLSGPGLVSIYRFLRGVRGGSEPADLSRRLEEGAGAPEIAEAALAGSDPVCVEALDMFAHVYGVEAGNLALKCLAVGGVYLGGGIAPKILPALRGGAFMRGFTDKGRFADLLSRIRVMVCLDSRAALVGAARIAADLAGRTPAAGDRTP